MTVAVRGSSVDGLRQLADRRSQPLFTTDVVEPPSRATDLMVLPCRVQFARLLIAEWHSRLPYTQRGPWRLAFSAEYGGTSFGVALWHNPSARTLPSNWLELRRLAVAPDAPHCTASRMLCVMRRYIAKTMPEVTRLISYQDISVHTGTIYRAAGWTPAYISKPRVRDRSADRVGTTRAYRSNSNGADPDAAGKIRWEISVKKQRGNDGQQHLERDKTDDTRE